MRKVFMCQLHWEDGVAEPGSVVHPPKDPCVENALAPMQDPPRKDTRTYMDLELTR